MQANYQAFVDRMIQKYEGGYGWDKGDPGGPTKYGITCYDLAEHRGQKMTSMTDWAPIVRAMTLAEAEAIYHAKYATTLCFDKLQGGVDCVMMDYGVNSGIERPIVVARSLLKIPGSKISIDMKLLDALNHVDAETFIAQMCSERLSFMHAIKGGSMWRQFGGGWQKRVDDLRVYSDHVAAGATAAAPHAPDLSNISTPKATNVVRSSTAGKATTMSPPVIVAAHAAGVDWKVAALIGVGVVVAGALYEAYQVHKADVANNTVHA